MTQPILISNGAKKKICVRSINSEWMIHPTLTDKQIFRFGNECSTVQNRFDRLNYPTENLIAMCTHVVINCFRFSCSTPTRCSDKIGFDNNGNQLNVEHTIDVFDTQLQHKRGVGPDYWSLNFISR